MSACYLCGNTDSHTYDCPKLVSITSQLSSSRDLPIITFKIKDVKWRIDIAKRKQLIPLWATRAWSIDGGDRAGFDTSLINHALNWQKYHENVLDEPGCSLSWLSCTAGENNNRTWDLLVFGPL